MMGRTKFWLLLSAVAAPLGAQTPGAEFFEQKIRPVLSTKCYLCHSSNLSSPMGALTLDTKAGLRKGGARGPVVIPRELAESRLLQALRYSDTRLQMPPA